MAVWSAVMKALPRGETLVAVRVAQRVILLVVTTVSCLAGTLVGQLVEMMED